MSFSLISDQKKKKIVPQKLWNCWSYPQKKNFFNFWFYFSNLRTLPEMILYYDQTKPNHHIRGSDFRLLYSNNCHSETMRLRWVVPVVSSAAAGDGGSVLGDSPCSSSSECGLSLVLTLPRPPPGLEHGADVIRGQGAASSTASGSPHSWATGIRHGHGVLSR